MAILFATFCVPGNAQNPSPDALVRHAMDRLQAAEALHARFTYFHDDHAVNTSDKGKTLLDVRYLYENTWINDLPYQRLVAVDGQPLTGKQLAEEQARYDRFVAAHRPLGPEQQIEIHGGNPVTFNLQLQHIAGPNYHLTFLRHETYRGQPSSVIQADPLPDPSIPQQQFTLWITDAPDPFLIRADFLYLDAEQQFAPGLHGQYDYQLFDNDPVMLSETSRAVIRLDKKHSMTMATDRNYLRYRRFQATFKLGPATAAPQDEAPKP